MRVQPRTKPSVNHTAGMSRSTSTFIDDRLAFRYNPRVLILATWASPIDGGQPVDIHVAVDLSAEQLDELAALHDLPRPVDPRRALDSLRCRCMQVTRA